MDANHGRVCPQHTVVLADTCGGPVLNTLHASSRLILLWAPGGGDHHHQQFANEETRNESTERMRGFPETLGFIVVELGFEPQESGFRAWEMSPPEPPAPLVCAAKAHLCACGLSAAHNSFHSKLSFLPCSSAHQLARELRDLELILILSKEQSIIRKINLLGKKMYVTDSKVKHG